MSNPWTQINLESYENHMKLSSINQLQALNSIMKNQIDDFNCSSIMILGVAGGNGLEHINPCRFNHVYGVDINRDYLNTCIERYQHISVFKAICADLTCSDLTLPNADLIISNLLIEYIGYDNFINTVNHVNPQYISCVIQVNTSDEFVSESPYTNELVKLDNIHNRITENTLSHYLDSLGFKIILNQEYSLPNGKSLVRIDYQKC